jgi:predicted AlkP superfamily pyrophosphatase or phosphodiesterase
VPSEVEAPDTQRSLDFARDERELMMRAILAFLIAFLPIPALAQTRPVTILISIDGFRADYLARGITPNLSRLAAGGAHAAMRPSFPSTTFPNHYTLVTGLRPDRHGIVGNTMEDARRPGETFTMATADPFWWSEAEPIWTTAERAGVHTATMFWPGSNLAIDNIRPRDWWLYSKDNSEAQRVDAVIDWLRRPAETRPQFVTLYFDTVDTAGHKYGPDGDKTNATIRAVDAQIGRLTEGLTTLGLSANLIIVADHGMAATSPERTIELWKIAKPKDYRAIGYGPVVGLVPTKGREARLAKALLKPNANMDCARKENLPPALHYGANPRVPPFICIARIGWLIVTAPPAPDKPIEAGGAHGYDPANREMDALFIGFGPAFQRGVALPAFDNVDVYPLLAKLIGVVPRAGDGSLASTANALRP